jgi:CubicO group peptidase (beta-lactamase class C family)
MLDAGCWILDTGYWILDAGCVGVWVCGCGRVNNTEHRTRNNNKEIMKNHFRPLVVAPILLIWLLFSCKNAPVIVTNELQRSIPEAEGVSSEGIITFLDSVAAGKHELHSIMILRHGKVVAEGWWSPYRPDLRHTMYSTSKSFTSTAIGFAVTEKLITVKDKVISFFPDDLPDTISPFLAELTIQNLLTMSAGQDPDPTSILLTSSDSNWVRVFLSTPIVNKPGTKFLYNSMATYMLSAIIQKVTGEKVIDYLTPRLFEPLGITGMDWESDPIGINKGGWGLSIKTEDMAKFGQLYLQKGVWNGKQLIPASWIEEATTFKIDQAPDMRQSAKDSSDWMQGYCYQFWRCRNNAYRADGAYGQYIIVIPEKDAVVAITSESPDMQGEINMVWDYLLPALKDDPLPANEDMASKLKDRLGKLALSPESSITNATAEPEISGKTFILDENVQKLNSFTCTFNNEGCEVVLKRDTIEYKIKYGLGEWIEDENQKPGPSLTGLSATGAIFKVAGACRWKDDKTLELVLRYIESPHHEKIICKFDKSNLILTILPSNAFGGYSTVITGKTQ